MPHIPEKCRNWKVARHHLFAWWCKGVCGRLHGKLCEPWCRLAERRGLWTLWLTLGIPVVIFVAVACLITWVLWKG